MAGSGIHSRCYNYDTTFTGCKEMSGGHFNYQQLQISQIADDLEKLVRDNNNEKCNGIQFCPDGSDEFNCSNI
jgi:hypothetical protein